MDRILCLFSSYSELHCHFQCNSSKSIREFYRYTTCNIITTGHLPPMIKIHTAQQKSHSAQLILSTLMSSSSIRQSWLFAHLKAGGGLFSIKYINGSSLIPKRVRDRLNKENINRAHSCPLLVLIWNFISKSLLETTENGDGTGKLSRQDFPSSPPSFLSY